MEIMELKARVNEEFDLSDEAKKEIEEARRTMKTEFVSHEKIMKRFG